MQLARCLRSNGTDLVQGALVTLTEALQGGCVSAQELAASGALQALELLLAGAAAEAQRGQGSGLVGGSRKPCAVTGRWKTKTIGDATPACGRKTPHVRARKPAGAKCFPC
jgi:hypothetical protein